jgi:hypothetical protein
MALDLDIIPHVFTYSLLRRLACHNPDLAELQVMVDFTTIENKRDIKKLERFSYQADFVLLLRAM